MVWLRVVKLGFTERQREARLFLSSVHIKIITAIPPSPVCTSCAPPHTQDGSFRLLYVRFVYSEFTVYALVGLYRTALATAHTDHNERVSAALHKESCATCQELSFEY